MEAACLIEEELPAGRSAIPAAAETVERGFLPLARSGKRWAQLEDRSAARDKAPAVGALSPAAIERCAIEGTGAVCHERRGGAVAVSVSLEAIEYGLGPLGLSGSGRRQLEY